MLTLLAQSLITFGPHLFNPSSSSLDVALELQPGGPRKVDVVTFDPVTQSFGVFPSNGGSAAVVHAVQCSPLQAGTVYCWAIRIADPSIPNTYSWSSLFMTRIPTAAGYRVGAWGDNQEGPATFTSICARMVGEGCEMVLGLGDYVRNDTEANWSTQFGQTIGPVIHYLPAIGCRGNHDGEGARSRARWLVPAGGGEHPNGEQWGSSLLYPALFVVLDSNRDTEALRLSMRQGGPQRAWLEQLVASSAWTTAPLRIVAFHHPVGTEQWDAGCWYPPRPELPMDPDWVWAMGFLADHGATVVLNGHAHAYQRGAWPSAAATPMPWVISGGGGGYLDQAMCRDMPQITFNQGTGNQRHHFLTLDVVPSGVTLRALPADGGPAFDVAVFPAR